VFVKSCHRCVQHTRFFESFLLKVVIVALLSGRFVLLSMGWMVASEFGGGWLGPLFQEPLSSKNPAVASTRPDPKCLGDYTTIKRANEDQEVHVDTGTDDGPQPLPAAGGINRSLLSFLRPAKARAAPAHQSFPSVACQLTHFHHHHGHTHTHQICHHTTSITTPASVNAQCSPPPESTTLSLPQCLIPSTPRLD
jgi:hypothetical protein